MTHEWVAGVRSVSGKALLGKRGVELMRDSDEESENLEDAQKTEIALERAMEYREIFSKWARPPQPIPFGLY